MEIATHGNSYVSQVPKLSNCWSWLEIAYTGKSHFHSIKPLDKGKSLTKKQGTMKLTLPNLITSHRPHVAVGQSARARVLQS